MVIDNLLDSGCLSGLSQKDALPLKNLRERVALLAEQLNHLNIKRVALYADNSPEWVLVDLACQKAGVVIIPLPLFFSRSQLQHALRACSIDTIFTDQPDVISTVFPHQDRQLCESTGFHIFKARIPENIAPWPEETAKITFTSGSTGNPKGVCLSIDNQLTVARALAETVDIREGRHLCVLPLGVLLENVAGVYASLFSDGEIIIPTLAQLGFRGSSSHNIQSLTDLITHSQPTTFICLPELLAGLVQATEHGWKPPCCLRFIAVGGAKVAPALLDKANTLGLPVYEGYGLSECASVVSLNTRAHKQRKSVGRPLPHLAVRIEDGEIIVRGNAFLGYVNDPDSWYPNEVATGDLGAVDSRGFLQVLGRKKNLLISSYGRNIHPEWLESELQNHPGITQAFVFGDEKPFCVALIVPRDPGQPDLLIQNWINQTNNLLPDYAHIRYWHRLPGRLTVEDGLMTQNGRPKRDEIAARYSDAIAALFRHPAFEEPLIQSR